MKNLLQNWGEVESLLRPGFFLLSDYDGTLTPLVGRPQDAKLPDDVRQLLILLAESHPVGIISGRSLKDIKRIVDVANIYYAGNHGLEIEGPGIRFVKNGAESVKPIISQICSTLGRELKHFKGVIIQNKGITASVHYRLVTGGKHREVRRIFNSVVKPYLSRGGIKVLRGKKVLELLPDLSWGKGEAVKLLIDTVRREKGEVVPIYMGDDLTDESAFRIINEIGISILVSEGRRKSNAQYFLRNTGEVWEFMRRIARGRSNFATE